MKPADTLKHTVAMVAAGIAAAGLILAATLLSPAAEPPSRAEGPSTVKPGAVTAEAIVGRWEFVGSSNPDAYVEFTEYGNWFGSDGCNGVAATWRLDGGVLRMQTPGAMTMIYCNNMNLPFGAPLEGKLAEDGTLTVMGKDGDSVQLTRVGDSISSLTAGDWATSKTSLTKQTADPTGPSITFAEDGTWSGSDGCNRVGGTWSWDLLGLTATSGEFGAILHFGENTFSTKMLCYGQPEPKVTFTGDYEFTVRGGNLTLRRPAALDPDQTWVMFTLFDS